MHIKKILPIALLIIVFVIVTGGAWAAYSPGEEGAICLGCHGSQGMTKTFRNGQEISLYVSEKNLSDSAHRGFDCTNCHVGFTAEDHPRRQFKSKRDYTLSASATCSRCHEFKKGIHKKMLGAVEGVVCVDCHGFHTVAKVEEGKDTCFECHRYDMTMSFRDGSTASAEVDAGHLKQSVHERLRCNDCHFGFSSREHPDRRFKDKRDFTIVSTEICRRCHFDKYTKTLESIHFNILTQGNLKAPVCVDCHGSHGITAGRTEKIRSAQRCEKCHSVIYDTYAKSVHGAALISEHNQDVPVCSDCHRAHDITDPRMTDFRNDVPQMCGNCHANEKLMAKYGLSTAVLDSYLEDFHGVTLTYYKKQEKPVRHIAVCIDCHGIHDITKVKGPNATVLKANLAKRCQKCHPAATENFPDSWISHYEPDFRRAPLVYGINMIYKVFIPFMIIGLVLQIILHIWRYAVNR